MSIQTSNTILKVSGIISIIFGVIGMIMAILGLTGAVFIGANAATNGATQDSANLTLLATLLGGLFLVTAIVSLLEGYFSLRAVKDNTKIMPAWIFAIIGLIIEVVTLANNLRLSTDFKSMIPRFIGLAISILIFVAADSIKRYVGK